MKNHLVHKIILEVSATNYEVAKELQAQAKNWTKDVFPTLLENSLNSTSGNGEFLLIEKLEIEIPNLPWKLTDLQWEELIKKQVLKSGTTKLSFEVVLKELIFYLERGSFASQSIFKNAKALENYMLKHFEDFSIENRNLSLEFFDSNEKVQRLFSSFSPNFVEEVLKKVFGIVDEESKILVTFFKKIIDENSLEKWELIPISVSILNGNNSEKRKQFFKNIVQDPLKMELKEQEENPKTEKRKVKKKDETEEKTQVYINCPNAGLVLLLPYIKPLFENLNLVKDKKFRNEILQQDGVQILHFLATGNSKAEEEDLVLPKLLCGYEIQDCVHIERELEDAKKEEGNLLLASVISHWNVLKSTSDEGFRNSFLQRTGRLKEEEQNYQLEVEESGIDILLNQLPWGFRNFKLPWMEKTILTQWY